MQTIHADVVTVATAGSRGGAGEAEQSMGTWSEIDAGIEQGQQSQNLLCLVNMSSSIEDILGAYNVPSAHRY